MAELQKGRTRNHQELFQNIERTMVEFMGGIGHVDVGQMGSLQEAYAMMSSDWLRTTNKWAGELV